MNRSHQVALSTDLYQLTMGASYAALGMDGRAIFSLFSRHLPEHRSFLVVAGIEEALNRLRELRFDDAALNYLKSTGQIREDFLQVLADFQFTGNVRAIPEGRVVFANEPILEVEGSILEAQLAETTLINAIHYPSLVATKAARCVFAASGKPLVDFGLRRTPGIEAGLAAARASYIAGFVATSNVLAGETYGIPVSGTVAHSFIETFTDESEAFLAFGRTFPGPATFLIDTYDTVEGARKTVAIARELAESGHQVAAVRLDSGDMASLSREVRRIFDDAGLHDIQIFASGGLDEYKLAGLEASSASIDAYGVGTRVGTSADAPTSDMAYKLVEYDGRPTLKLSSGKRSLVGPKQVWRRYDEDGQFQEDRIAAADEESPGNQWEPLLEPVMSNGEILHEPTLEEIKHRHQQEMSQLPAYLMELDGQAEYPVRISETLQRRQQQAEEQIQRR